MSKSTALGYVYPVQKAAAPISLRDDLLGRVNSEFDKFFSEFFSPHRSQRVARASYPKVDVYRDGEDLVLQAAVPGCKRENINIEIVDDMLTISCKLEQNLDKFQRDYYTNELKHSSWTRSFTLGVGYPEPHASLQDGVLTLRFSSVFKEDKPVRKTIKVNG